MADNVGTGQKPSGNLLGSLRDVLKAASRDDDERVLEASRTTASDASSADANQPSEGATTMSASGNDNEATPDNAAPPPLPATPSAAEAARQARGGTPNIPPVKASSDAGEAAAPPTTRVVRTPAPEAAPADQPKTQLVRGRQQVQRGAFTQDPVVGWLVIVGGPGIGAYRPVFEGNNTVGRNATNRVAVDFGDDAISGDEQAYIRYDSADRSFLLVPNLSKTNVVSVNDQRPTGAVPLQTMDVITMGRTQLVFVPFCGPEFDWGELAGVKS